MSAKAFFFRFVTVGAVLCALSTSASAEVKVGDKAAPVKVDKLANTKFKSLKDLKGSLVLYEYFAHW